MSDPVTFKNLLVGTRFKFASIPHGKTYKKVGPNQFRVANHPHLFRAENETQVLPLPNLPESVSTEFLPLTRASRGKRVASAKGHSERRRRMKLSRQARQDIKDLGGLLFGTFSLIAAVIGILLGPDILAAIAADHPIAMATQALLAGR